VLLEQGRLCSFNYYPSTLLEGHGNCPLTHGSRDSAYSQYSSISWSDGSGLLRMVRLHCLAALRGQRYNRSALIWHCLRFHLFSSTVLRFQNHALLRAMRLGLSKGLLQHLGLCFILRISSLTQALRSWSSCSFLCSSLSFLHSPSSFLCDSAFSDCHERSACLSLFAIERVASPSVLLNSLIRIPCIIHCFAELIKQSCNFGTYDRRAVLSYLPTLERSFAGTAPPFQRVQVGTRIGW
jgi:hypothetical protein